MSNTVTPTTIDISLAPSRLAKGERRPMSAEQRAKLSAAQRAYVANGPRWMEHRRKLAAAHEARRMTLMETEVAAILEMRRKGRRRARRGRGFWRCFD
jgi:predicted RecB family nuclease